MWNEQWLKEWLLDHCQFESWWWKWWKTMNEKENSKDSRSNKGWSLDPKLIDLFVACICTQIPCSYVSKIVIINRSLYLIHTTYTSSSRMHISFFSFVHFRMIKIVFTFEFSYTKNSKTWVFLPVCYSINNVMQLTITFNQPLLVAFRSKKVVHSDFIYAPQFLPPIFFPFCLAS